VKTNRFLLVATLAALASGCTAAVGDDDASHVEDAVVSRQDSLDRPTDTHVKLVAGLWHDNKLVPGEGWHKYTFTAKEDGLVTFQMQAPKGHPNLWSYLRIVEPIANNEVWAGVGNKRSNLCEVIVPAEKGKTYDVIVTSQENSLLAEGKRQQTDGPYTVAVSPVAISFPGL
jgi:hypothetical protein